MKIDFLINFLPNPRIMRRISLAKEFGEINLICWDRGSNMQNTPDIGGVETTIIEKKTSKSEFFRAISFLSVKKASISKLKEIHPEIIHIQGLDMLGAAIEYKKRFNNKVVLIYEVADLHKLIVDEQKKVTKKIIQYFVRNEEIRCCKEIDLLIVTSEQYYSSHFSNFVPPEKYVYIPNIPDLSAFTYFSKEPHRSFTVGYLGVIRYKKQIRLLLEASKKTNIHLLFAGYEQNGNEIENECKQLKDIEWVGRFSFFKQAAQLYGRCDAIFSVYDADMQNCKVALPNKLYESIYCEIPIIVAKGTFLSDLVEEWGVGISVKHDSLDELTDAVFKLQDPAFYARLISNCKRHKNDIDSSKYNRILVEKIQLAIKNKKEDIKND